MSSSQISTPMLTPDFESFWESLRQLLPLPSTPPARTAATPVSPVTLEEPLQLSLQRILTPARVFWDAATLGQYARDNSYAGYIQQEQHPQLPAAVVMPQSEQEIAQLMVWAAEREVSLLPWGKGKTPYLHKQRHPLPFIIVDLCQLQRVLEIDPQRQMLRAQSGCSWKDLEATLQAQQFTLGHAFAWNIATVGGVLATQSLNLKSLRYGTLCHNVQNIRAVCPSGPLQLQAPRPGKPDERVLMLGTRGAWGIITEATLRLFPLPQERLSLTCGCTSWNEAWAILQQLRQANLELTALRLSTTRELSLFGLEPVAGRRLLLRSLRSTTPAEVQLLIELEGSREKVLATRRAIEELLSEKSLQSSNGSREARAREGLYPYRMYLLQQLWERGLLAYSLTAAVPWSIAATFLRDWEEALRSILLTSSGKPGHTLSTVWAAQDYVQIYTLLLGYQAPTPAARLAQLEDIHAVALTAKQRWQIEETAAPLVQQAFQVVGNYLDPDGIMLR